MRRIGVLAVVVAFAMPATAAASSWQWMNMPVPAGTTGGYMSGVSCTAAKACTSVGYFSTAQSPNVALAERWNGSSWQVQPTRSAGTYSAFSDVACRSASFCVAVGWYSNTGALYSANTSTLAERWNGSTWSVIPTPNLGSSDELSGVSCASGTACLAVGQAYFPNAYGGAGAVLPFAERWNGSQWSATAPTASLGHEYVTGAFVRASCVSATSCFAVGSTDFAGGDSSPLIESWNGASWQLDNPSNGVVGIETLGVESVSCVSRVFCVAGATGFAYNNNFSNTVPGALGWNGTSWQTQNVAPLNGTGNGDFYGVSCASATDCNAVGDDTYNGTLAEVWNGSNWTIQNTRNPGSSPTLYDVSCVSSVCMAVGNYRNAHNNSVPLAEDN